MMPSDATSLFSGFPPPGKLHDAAALTRVRFDGVVDLLRQIAPQLAAQGARLAWEAWNNRKGGELKVKAIIAHQSALLQEAYDVQKWNEEKLDRTPLGPGAESPQVWGSLGDIEFDILSAPSAFSGKDGATYVQHTIIGGKPRLQSTGDALQSLTLKLAWHCAVVPDIEARFEALLSAMRGKAVLPLVVGRSTSGSVYARDYVITEIDHKVTKHNPDGSLMAMEATVQLLEWPGDADLEVSKVKPKAVAKKGAQPPPQDNWQRDAQGNYVLDAKGDKVPKGK